MYGWRNDFRAYPEKKLALAIFTNHWRILRPGREFDLIAGFVVSWLDRETEGRNQKSRPETTWLWKQSYVMGLVMAEQLRPAIGIAEPLSAAMIDAMTTQTLAQNADQPRNRVWDEDGFRRGVEDLVAVRPQSYDAIRAFLRSDRLRILPEELELIKLELGID